MINTISGETYEKRVEISEVAASTWKALDFTGRSGRPPCGSRRFIKRTAEGSVFCSVTVIALTS